MIVSSEPFAPPSAARWGGWDYVAALGLTALATGAAMACDRALGIPNVSLVFVLPVVTAAAVFGWGPALAAAVGGALAYNFFLIAPRHTLRVDDPANIWALVLLLATAGIVSAVAAQSRRRALEALAHAERADALQGLARALVAARDRPTIAQATAVALAQVFRTPAVVLVSEADRLALSACSGSVELSAADKEAAAWSLASRLPTRADSYPVEAALFDFWPVPEPGAVVGVRFPSAERPAATERFVEIVTGYVSVALSRDALARKALAVEVTQAGERLKADLLAAVSHDLKTPLSTILFTLQSLQRFGEVHDAAARAELLALAETETARLAGLVEKLLDMSRIDAGAVVVRLAPASPADLVAAALARSGEAMAQRSIDNRVSGAQPPILVDEALAEAALANVLENAARYAAVDTVISIRAVAGDGVLTLEVLDEGPGFPGDGSALFEKFARGVKDDGRAPGLGLGLAIARGFMTAQGGRIEAGNRTGRPGALVRLTFPLAQVEARP